MQLETLTLSNVGPFGSQQTFELAPRIRYGAKRPIILFGGLNGAGKTTFLTAIRLVLYGRHSVEAGTTQKQYEDYLRDLVHRPVDSTGRSTASSIALEFTYARLGQRVRYRVTRTWDAQPSSVEERLRIFKDGQEQEELNDDQAQAFLNQTIPSGISQFFFFDGEKIAALARDDSDAVLADAIRRLLGLDLADRLNSDLSVFLRNRRASRHDEKTQIEIARIEAELGGLRDQIDTESHLLEEQINPALDSAKSELERRRGEMLSRGGAWAVDRTDLEQRLDSLRTEKKKLEDDLREQLSGVAIFTLAPQLSKSVSDALENSQALADKRALSKTVAKQASVLKARLATLEDLKGTRRVVAACIDEWVAEITSAKAGHSAEVDFGMSDADARNVVTTLRVAAPAAQRELANTFSAARRIATEEDSVHDKLAHAPSDGALKEAFDALTIAAQLVATHQSVRKQLIEEIRRKMWASIDLTRKLKKLYATANSEVGVAQGERAAESLQDLIADFKVKAAKSKCEVLRKHFLSAFSRLARKGDIVHDVRIDPESFVVTLLDRGGEVIPKKRLSAGEMQIYAIAMLEGLGKSSGRNLPIIIDTPLGRLDSQHRQKIVESYFPTASHQVIVLSTDTEVDRSFYRGLQPHLSHGYHLTFDESKGATKVEDGYFWKEIEEIRKNAA
jgi:DNA sulfur modification protein DndD